MGGDLCGNRHSSVVKKMWEDFNKTTLPTDPHDLLAVFNIESS